MAPHSQDSQWTTKSKLLELLQIDDSADPLIVFIKMTSVLVQHAIQACKLPNLKDKIDLSPSPSISEYLQTFVEEDYQIASFIPSAEYPNDGLNFTEYTAVLTATFYQPFDFSGVLPLLVISTLMWSLISCHIPAKKTVSLPPAIVGIVLYLPSQI